MSQYAVVTLGKRARDCYNTRLMTATRAQLGAENENEGLPSTKLWRSDAGRMPSYPCAGRSMTIMTA